MSILSVVVLGEAENLLEGKLRELKEFAPAHLRNPGHVFVVCCPEGVCIRYEGAGSDHHLTCGWADSDLPNLIFGFSQGVVQCRSSVDAEPTHPAVGAEFCLFRQNAHTEERTLMFKGAVSFDVVLKRPNILPQPPRKPFCLMSLYNSIELGIVGEFLEGEGSPRVGHQFVIRTTTRLPFGWECVEAFPFVDLQQWKPDYARMWAENDLQASVLAHHSAEAHYESLDPKAKARREIARVLQAFKELLESNPEREEVLQVYLRENARLLCPAFTQVWPKLALGAHKTDFVFRDAIGEYLLVELERSNLSLFLKDGHASRDLNHACGQITDWNRYLEDNLATVQRELGLTGISSSPRGLVVIGRSRTLTDANRRKLKAMANQTPKVRIMTYDDVYDEAKAVIENLLGPIWEPGGNTRVYYLQGKQTP